MDEAFLASYASPHVFSWLHVFYSPFYITGGGSFVIESETEKNKENKGGDMKMEQDEEGGWSCRRQTQLTPGIIQGSDVLWTPEMEKEEAGNGWGVKGVRWKGVAW